MCGIIGYIGTREAYPILINGLTRLEYRGYDSAGIALLNQSLEIKDQKVIKIFKEKGKISELEKLCEGQDHSGSLGIGHTRWATHGEPSILNAHPHTSQSGTVTLVHNGIIENYLALRTQLEIHGYQSISETDTEVLANLIDYVWSTEKCSFEEAIRLSLLQVVGAYAIAVISKNEPDTIIAACKSSPLVVGIGTNELFLGSDASAIIAYTKDVTYIHNSEMVTLKRDGSFELKTLDNTSKTPKIQKLEMELEQLEKNGYDYFMLKEIHEQPKTIEDSFRGRLRLNPPSVLLGGIQEHIEALSKAERIIFVGCGTSWNSALVAKYLIEDLAGIPVEVEYASEFRYRNPVIKKTDFVIGVSQSGETADTKAALELAKEKGATILGICNVVGSSIARMTDAGCYTHAGPEIGVASTKAFTAQLTVFTLMALELASHRKNINETLYNEILQGLQKIPEQIEEFFSQEKHIEKIATKLIHSTNALYLGRGYNYPIALEGALKLKEISYIHAEGYPAAEMKHGAIALIDENMPVIVIANNQSAYQKIYSNIQEIKARKGKVIAIVEEGDHEIAKIADEIIYVPKTLEALTPLLSVVPLQLLGYYVAVKKGNNVDQPRNLAKSVTVE